MTIIESLQSLSAYPIPMPSLVNIAEEAGLVYSEILLPTTRRSAAFKRATANVWLWLSEAPNVTQDGISYSFSDGERNRMRAKGEALLAEIGDSDEVDVEFGYKGEDL